MREFGESVLRIRDPDGIIVKLVARDMPAAAPLPGAGAPTRLRAVTLLTAEPEAAMAMLARFGYRPGAEAGAIRRMLSDTDAVDVRAVAGFTPGIPGTGTLDHLALRAPDAAAVEALAAALPADLGPVHVHDRKYFHSAYVRDAGGILYEYASDGPGFAVDEPEGSLGTTLFLPPERAGDLAVMLPQFALPGEARPPRRQLLFIHRLHVPDPANGRVLILLHGTGGNETSLLPLARRMDPGARLIGLRGRATEEGRLRWFRRFGPDRFDQDDIRAEGEALAAVLPDLGALHGFDPAEAVFVGHSNGANFLAALMRLRPGLIRRAVLLRAQEVLEDAPEPPGAGGPSAPAAALILRGSREAAAPSDRLAEALARAGVAVTLQAVEGGHDLVPADADRARDWLARMDGEAPRPGG